MSANQRFEAAVVKAKTLPAQSNETLLRLYGLYKQATAGDAAGPPPGAFDLRGKAKREAWEACRGMTPKAAMADYADLVDSLAKG